MRECPQCGYDIKNSDGPPRSVTFIYARRTVWFRKQSCKLTAKEMEIFEHLYDAGSRGCTTNSLCDAIYAERDPGSPSPTTFVLSVHLCNMRRKLREIGVILLTTGRMDDTRYFLTVPNAASHLMVVK